MSIVYVFTWDIELLLMSAGWRWSLLCLCIWFGLGAAELMSSFFFLELDRVSPPLSVSDVKSILKAASSLSTMKLTELALPLSAA